MTWRMKIRTHTNNDTLNKCSAHNQAKRLRFSQHAINKLTLMMTQT